MTPAEAKEFFEKALEARHELEHIHERLAKLQALPHSSGIVEAVNVGTTSDPTAKVATKIVDIEDLYNDIRDSRLEQIHQAIELISGVRQGLGLVYGDVLEDYYIRGLTWRTVAQVNGDVGVSTVIRRRDVALEWIASTGIHRASSGDGGPAQAT